MKMSDDLVIPIKIGNRNTKVVIACDGDESTTSRILDACKSAFGPGRLVPGPSATTYNWIKDDQDTEA